MDYHCFRAYGGIMTDLLLNFSTMLENIAILLVILWALGLVSSYTLGGFIHLLIVIAIILYLVKFINRRK